METTNKVTEEINKLIETKEFEEIIQNIIADLRRALPELTYMWDLIEERDECTKS